ncbi:MAG TPA: hypothetical protein VM008_10320 [Phycisphaerae bacterium]|nr:hypothetical protein [Phycisphaerae bacterium]
MTEDAQLDAALKKADDVLAASLRREEAQRKSRRNGLALVCSFLLGTAVGAATMALWPRQPAPSPARPLADSPAPSIVPPPAPTTGPCEVKYANEWRRASIVDRDQNIFQVKYDDWPAFFNEWVTPDRIRPIGSKWDALGYATPTPHGQKPMQPKTAN